MTRPLALLVAALATAAPAIRALAQGVPDRPAAPQSPAMPNVNPAGTYDVTVVVQGTAMLSTIKVEQKADSTFAGTVTTDAYGVFTISSLKVIGKEITIVIYTQDGSPVTIALTLNGELVSGEWYMSSDGSKVTGKKRPVAP